MKYILEEFYGDEVDYFSKFIRIRQFKSVDELYAWANMIATTIGFRSTSFSYKHKDGHSVMIIDLCCHRYGRFSS